MTFKHYKITDPEWLGNCKGVGWSGHKHLFEGRHTPKVVVECGCGLALTDTQVCPICGEGESNDEEEV